MELYKFLVQQIKIACQHGFIKDNVNKLTKAALSAKMSVVRLAQ